MKQFILFVLGLVAIFVLIGTIGPLILLGLGIVLLYFVFKKFLEADTIGAKIGWTVLGFIIISVAISNMYALVGIAAAYGLYLIYKEFKRDKHYDHEFSFSKQDPFTNFEKEWAELNK